MATLAKEEQYKTLKQAEKYLTRLPVNFRTVLTKNIADAQQHAADAVSKGEYIAVIGGDGSINAITPILKNSNGVLAVIPAGRGNDFARMLNYPLNTAGACEVLAYGKEITIDMGLANQKPFLNICSIGFDSLANTIASQTKLITGAAVYVYAGLRALYHWQALDFKVTVDGKDYAHRGYNVAVANSQCYGGGLYLSPHSSIHDGLLEVILLSDIKKHRLIANIPRLFKGTHINEPGFTILTGKKIRIETNTPYAAYADGEKLQCSPIDIEVLPNSLRVLVP